MEDKSTHFYLTKLRMRREIEITKIHSFFLDSFDVSYLVLGLGLGLVLSTFHPGKPRRITEASLVRCVTL